MSNYDPLSFPEDNLIKLLREQNDAGVENGKFSGSEPFSVLAGKAIFNNANSGGSLGTVVSVNGETGVVVIDKADIGLSAVPNTNATVASNISSGTLPSARLPAFTGDATSTAGTSTLTLAAVNPNTGTFGDSTHVAQITVNNKGIITAVADVAIAGGGGGGGNVTGPGSSVNNQIVLFADTSGALIKAATNTGILMATSGVIGSVTAPSGTIIGTTDSQTMTNKTLTAPVINGTITGTYTIGGTPTFPSTIVTTTGTQTLSGKTISGASNTLTVRLANDVTGNLPVTNLNSGTGASNSTFWRGDGTWATVSGSGDVTQAVNATAANHVFVSGGANKTRVETPVTINPSTGDMDVPGDVDAVGALTATSGTVGGFNIGYRETPINSQSADYTLLAADAAKGIVHPAADNNARVFTIPANASVAYPIGTKIDFVNFINTLSVAITSDTMTLFAGSGTGTTGTRTIAAGGRATAHKTSSTGWIMYGDGVS